MEEIQIIETITRNGDVKFKSAVLRSNVAGLANIGDKKFIIKGQPKIQIMRGNPIFGDEIQFCILTRAGSSVIQNRDKISSQKWEQIEICIPLKEGIELIKRFEKEVLDTNNGDSYYKLERREEEKKNEEMLPE